VTDPLQIVPGGLDTVPTAELMDYLKRYLEQEAVETIVLGEPFYPDGNPAQIHHLVIGLFRKLKKNFPDQRIELQDERFTSEDAKAVIRQSGARQKKRRDKSLVDKVSATLILSAYMEQNC